MFMFMFMMVWMFVGVFVKLHYDLSYVTSSEELANVMLLIDDSGSMNSIIYAAGFDPTLNRTPARECNAFLGLCSGRLALKRFAGLLDCRLVGPGKPAHQ